MRELLKKYLPEKIINELRCLVHPKLIYERYLILKQPIVYKRIIKKNKKRIYKVAFFVTHSSVWKYDYLYYLMQEHECFEPIVVICPVVNYGKDNMVMEIERGYKLFKDKGYNVVCAYDKYTDSYMDIREVLSPDIIFYTNPYRGLIDDKYFITKFLGNLTCYAPYSASVCNTPIQYNKLLTSVVWMFFLENDLSYNIAKKQMYNHARNVSVSGFPQFDTILSGLRKPINVWKHNQEIRIIWAPHHSFDDGIIHFSSFFKISEAMVVLRNRYREHIQIAFKPHPLLYVKLKNVWGEQKTDEYFREWADGENSQYEYGDYLDLFMTSDAMIFDSVSFIYEYLFTRKPSLFINGQVVESQLNNFGKEALKCHQVGYDERDIESFINARISKEEDPLYEEKQKFYKEYIIPSNSKLASQNILDSILESLSIS